MSNSFFVFKNQLALFKREKGMLFFYCLSIVVMGIIVPIFMRGVESSLTMAVLLTTTFSKPILSESLAGERENRTLETLLSSTLSGKSIIWGKIQFSILFAVCFFGLTALCSALTNQFIGYEMTMEAWQWIGIILFAVLNFSAISVVGVYISATSSDLRVANSRISRSTYPLGFIFLVYLTAVAVIDFIPALIISAILMIIYLFLIVIIVVKIIKMKQSDYYEKIKVKRIRKEHLNHSYGITPKSQFRIVFGFEIKYLLTWKILLLNFGILCFGPALIACLLPFSTGLPFYTGKIELNYAVLITVLMIPRVPTNIIACSIGGEKAYKTGESLLSTPLHVRSIFLAKCMVPILVSTIMLIVSSLFTLMGAAIYDWITPDKVPISGYTIEQLVLLFPVGIMSSMLMMFLSATFTLIMKTPRQGLYINSVISFIFVAPVLAIVYLTNNVLLWSLIYFAVLLIGSVICVRSISDRISRPQIMSRL